MASNDHLSIAHRALHRAAERVIHEYRNHDEIEIEGATEGKLARLRRELALALDDLETALDV